MSEEQQVEEIQEAGQLPLVEEEEPAGLSRREAMEKAMEKHGNPFDDKEPSGPVEEEPATKEEVREELDTWPDAPAEFNKAEKEAYAKKDVDAVVKAYRRIHDDRTKAISRTQTEANQLKQQAERDRREAEMWREQLGPYANDEIKPQQALKLVKTLRESNPQEIRKEFEKLGIDLDGSAPASAGAIPTEVQQTITALQEQVNSLTMNTETQQREQAIKAFDVAFNKMTEEKSRTGEPVFPDLELDGSSEEGKQFFASVGSFAMDPRFQAGVMRRIPDADWNTIVREAYKTAGGRVSENAAKVSQENPEKIKTSRRAAGSAPGRTPAPSTTNGLKNKLSRKDALRQAWKEFQEE